MHPDPAAELNEPQARAVAQTEGPLLVFAGAGSGKTRVITYRVANLLATHRVPPWKILCVTFTNKAAGEMRARLERLVGEDVGRDLWVGTFHATCARLLRRYHSAVGLGRDFVIYDDGDQRAVVARIVKELDLDDRRWPARALLARIHKEKQEGRSPRDVTPESYVDDKLVEVYERYEKKLASCNAVDFDDLLLHVMRISESESPEGYELRERFRYVLVDEFQDTNHVQYRLLRQLVAGHRNLCVVGDDDQSIYRWRGADVRNIRGFRHDFPGAEVVKLEQNYRSAARIVRVALSVIAESRDREPKELWTDNDEGAKVSIVSTRDERDEAAFVVARVRELVAGGTSPRDIAVFYRTHAQSRVLEEAMRSENVPYQIIGGTKFFDRAEVKDVVAYLRVLANPRSDVDLQRIINVPARGIGSTTVDRLLALADERGISLYDAVEVGLDAPELGSAARKKLASFRVLITGLAREAAQGSPSEMAARVLDASGYRKVLEAEDSPEADARLENLGELISSIGEYEEEALAAGDVPSLSGWLERVTLAADADQLGDVPKVPMMTVHAAKGLEFEAVLMTGMEDEVFPYKGLAPDERDELEEERRLAYVAITRARRRLWMTHTAVRTLYGQTRYGRPSLFLRGLPADAVEQLSTQPAPTARFEPRVAPAPVTRWSHPQARVAPAAPPAAAGERYIDREVYDDTAADDAEHAFAPGARVRHARFGDGEVRRLEAGTEPIVVAFFPGWGEKKILARFLQPGS